MSPRVSIIIPCYNAEQYISASIESAITQADIEPEIIIVDDGSTDKSLQEVARFGDQVRLIRNDHRGASAARNAGLEAATGDYIQFLDADDLIDPNKIAFQLQQLIDGQKNSIAICSWAYFSGDTIEQILPYVFWKDYEQSVDLLVDMWWHAGFLPCHSFLIPRSLINQVGPWNENLSADDDGEFFGRVIAGSDSVTFAADTAVYYRKPGSDNLSRRASDEALQSKILATSMVAERILNYRNDRTALEAIRCRWESLAYYLAQQDYRLMRKALSHARNCGPTNRYQRIGGRAFCTLRKYFGMRCSLALLSIYHRWIKKS